MGLPPLSPTPESTDTTTTVQGHINHSALGRPPSTDEKTDVVDGVSATHWECRSPGTSTSLCRYAPSRQDRSHVWRRRLPSAATKLEAEDKWLSDLPHLMFHTTGSL